MEKNNFIHIKLKKSFVIKKKKNNYKIKVTKRKA